MTEGPYELPKGWRWVRLKDSASASVSRGMAASQLHFCKPSQSPSQEPLVLLD